MAATLTFLHTSPAHIATFDALLADLAAGVPARHIVDESLLREARAEGAITPQLVRRVEATIREAAMTGAAVILCTCSTLGGTAVSVETRDAIVLRVDRPMAEQAVATGERIIVAAALASTLGPTRALLDDVARQGGKPIRLIDALCAPAWVMFERGDHDGYLRAIAARLEQVAGEGDVIVLAQASMAGATRFCPSLPVPVLSSPRLGLEAAVAAYRARTEA